MVCSALQNWAVDRSRDGLLKAGVDRTVGKIPDPFCQAEGKSWVSDPLWGWACVQHLRRGLWWSPSVVAHALQGFPSGDPHPLSPLPNIPRGHAEWDVQSCSIGACQWSPVLDGAKSPNSSHKALVLALFPVLWQWMRMLEGNWQSWTWEEVHRDVCCLGFRGSASPHCHPCPKRTPRPAPQSPA